MLRIVGENQVFRELRVADEQLPHVALLAARHRDRHAIRALAFVVTREQFPLGINRRHFERHLISTLAARRTRAGCRKERNFARRLRAVGGDIFVGRDHLTTCHRRVAFDLRAEVDERADDQNEDARVDHPHSVVHRLERNAPQSGDRDIDRDEDHHQIERPPVEPLELGHLESTPLTQLIVCPVRWIEDVPCSRVEVGIDDAGAPNRRIDEEEREQPDAELDVREEVERPARDALFPPRKIDIICRWRGFVLRGTCRWFRHSSSGRLATVD